MPYPMENAQQGLQPSKGENRTSLLALPAEIRNSIWELLTFTEGDVRVRDAYSSYIYSRPAILKVCHQLENEISPIFWGRSVIALDNYYIPHFIDDWGLETMHMIRHLKLLWCADSDARTEDLRWDQASTEDFCGLETLELCLGRYATKRRDRHRILTERSLADNWFRALVFMRSLQNDERLPKLIRATREACFTDPTNREPSLRLISTTTSLKELVSREL